MKKKAQTKKATSLRLSPLAVCTIDRWSAYLYKTRTEIVEQALDDFGEKMNKRYGDPTEFVKSRGAK